MTYLLMLCSITMETAKNSFTNAFSKKSVKSRADIYKFNVFLYLGAFLLMLVFGWRSISLFTVLLGLLFGFITVVSQVFAMQAFTKGPMSFTIFIQGCGLIIPSFYGALFLGEKITVTSVVAILVLLVTMALVLDIRTKGINLKWLIYSLLSMVFTGFIGVLQTIHQNSVYRKELYPFLSIAFAFSVVLNLAGAWRSGKKEEFFVPGWNRTVIIGILSGVFIGAVNVINLYLAGVVDKIILFPIVNGGLIFMTLAAGVIFFREKINAKQWVGLILGIAAICLLGLNI